MILTRHVGPVGSLRFDPDYDTSPTDRLAFARFMDWPLFSRVDLHLIGDFAGQPPFGAWSAAESALMNAVGALKAFRRGRNVDIDGLLSRGFTKINSQDPGGDPRMRIQALALAAGS